MKETGALCTPHSIDGRTDSQTDKYESGPEKSLEERRERERAFLLQFNYCDGERE